MVKTSLIVFLLAVSAGLLTAQTVVLQGTAQDDALGFAIDGAGDVNGDGFDDVVVGAPFDSSSGLHAGSVRVLSGHDGAVLHLVLGTSQSRLGWYVAGVGDVNADGLDDFAAAHHSGGVVRVYSGLDASPLLVLAEPPPSIYGNWFGTAFDGVGDLDGDGHADVVVGAWGDDSHGNQSGRAYVFSGADGTVLLDLHGLAGEGAGWAVAGVGDVDRDGVPDLAVGAPTATTAIPFSGRVRVHSGSDGAVLQVLDGLEASSRFGAAVAGAGDVNADGFADVIVGAPWSQAAAPGSGAAHVYSGADGSLLLSFQGSVLNESLGSLVDGGGDVDGDGRSDLLVCSTTLTYTPGLPTPFATLRSGADGSVLATLTTPLANSAFPGRVAGDLNADGFMDLVFGSPQAANGPISNAGAVSLYRSPTLPALHYRSETRGDLELDLSWRGSGGDPLALTGDLTIAMATPGGAGILLSSLARRDDLANGYLPLLVAPDPTNLLQYWFFGFDGGGGFQAAGVSRLHPFLGGTRVHLQAFEWSPVIRASNGLRLQLET